MTKYSAESGLVSIIMNCRNSQRYLREALDSVYAQSYSNFEIIFWDNASSDDSAAIARSYGEKVRYFHSEDALTLGEARNKALSQAGGSYLAFLDCDDVWLAHKLETQINVLSKAPDADFVYCNYYRIIMPDIQRRIVGLKGPQPEGDVFGRFLYSYPVNLQTVMLRMDAVKKNNVRFDERLELSEEFDFFMRLLITSKAVYIDKPAVIYRIHQDMSSLRLRHKHAAEVSYVLDKFREIDGRIGQKYARALGFFEAKLGYWQAQAQMEQNNILSARSDLAPYRFVNFNFFILYFMTFLPPEIWKMVHRFKIEGKLSWIS